jgi:D-beta-D-heptose 7-phosphate kinase/D-beta-D-heptose 1-phosphate adenosyltransferase
MYERLLKTIGNLGTPRILVVGDFMLDVYVYGDALRISPEAPVPVLKVTETEYRCGGAASVAADVAALGAKPICIGVVGDDADGRLLKDKLAGMGADVTSLREVSERPTITKQRLIGLAQHRHKQQLIRVDREVTTPLPDEAVDRLCRDYQLRLPEADIVCLQDYNKGVLAPATCVQMIQWANQRGKRTLVDPVFSADYSKYRGATLVKPNRHEVGMAAAIEVKTVTNAAEAANRLLRGLDLDAVVVTMDKEGAYLATAEMQEHLTARPRTVYDVTGAGDVVLATLAVALSADSDYVTAVQLANIAGGIEVEKFGASTVSVPEIVHEVATLYGGGNTKLRTEETLLEEIAWRRKRGQTIVFTNGCFDVIHRGHIEYLAFCKTQGNVVVVGLNSDASVTALKGPGRPVNNQQDRAAVLAGLETIDLITVFDEPSVLNLVKKVRPDVIVKGGDWKTKEGVVGHEFVESYGGKVVVAPMTKGKSSTATIEKLKALQAGT